MNYEFEQEKENGPDGEEKHEEQRGKKDKHVGMRGRRRRDGLTD